MANLPESSIYDAGVYQLETTDPVVGGADGKSNAAAINLANRTTYLKAHVDALEVIVPQAEAEARTATTRRGWTAQRVGQAIAAAITALVVQATETVKGIAEVATQAETNAGANDTLMVTPFKLRFGCLISMTPNGFIVFPEWMGSPIVQWGNSATDTTGHATPAFTIAFPVAPLAIIGMHNGTGGAICIASLDTLTSFNAAVTRIFQGVDSNGQIYGFFWFAIGR